MERNLKKAKRAWERRRDRRGLAFLMKQNEHQGWLDKLLHITKGKGKGK